MQYPKHMSNRIRIYGVNLSVLESILYLATSKTFSYVLNETL